MSKIFKAAIGVFEVVIGAVLLFTPGWQAIGLSLLLAGVATEASLFAPKPAPWRGDSLQITFNPTEPRKVVVGRTAVGGSLITFQTWGDQNRWLILLIAVADHRVEGMPRVYFNGKWETPGGDGAIPGANVDGTDYLWVNLHNGDWNQDADAELITASSGRWTTEHRLRGVAYVKIKALKNDKAHPNGLSGLFQTKFEINGLRTYDRRLDDTAGGAGAMRWDQQETWHFDDNQNAARILENVWRGIRVEDETGTVGSRAMDVIYGLRLTDADIPFDEGVAALNACDEAVATKAGPTEPRYAAAGVLSTGQPPRNAQNDLLIAMAGKALNAPGRWIILPGVARTPVRTLTDADWRIDGPEQYQAFAPLGSIANAVTGRFADPEQFYQPIDLPARRNSADAIADGGEKITSLEMTLVTSQSQGQRLMEIERRRGRLQKSLTRTAKPQHMDLEGGDIVTVTDSRRGFTADFEVQTGGLDLTDDGLLKLPLPLKETSNTVFDWVAATDEIDRANPTSGWTDPPADSAAPSIANAYSINAGGGVRIVVDITGGPSDPGLDWIVAWQVAGEAGWSQATFAAIDGPSPEFITPFVPQLALADGGISLKAAVMSGAKPIWSAVFGPIDTTIAAARSLATGSGDVLGGGDGGTFTTGDGT